MSDGNHNQIFLEPALTCSSKNNKLWIYKNILAQLQLVKTAAMTKTTATWMVTKCKLKTVIYSTVVRSGLLILHLSV